MKLIKQAFEDFQKELMVNLNGGAAKEVGKVRELTEYGYSQV